MSCTPTGTGPAPGRPAPTNTPAHLADDAPIPELAGCPLLDRDHVLRARIDGLPVRAGSSTQLEAAGRDLALRPLFGSELREGSRPGLPVNVVDGDVARRVTVVLSSTYGPGSDNGIPWPAEPRIEGWPLRAWDRRMIVLDSATCEFWEAGNLQPPEENPFGALAGTWYADKVVRWAPQAPEPDTAITGSGLPFLPGLVRYDEVAAGRIGHALLVTLPNASAGDPVWPATVTDGRNPDPAAPPMGTWLRLRADADVSTMRPQARVVARALREHGMIVSDSAPHLGLRGEPDLRWDDDDLRDLGSLTLDDFEVVDPSSLVTDPSSWSVR